MVDPSLVISIGAIVLSALTSLEKCFQRMNIKKCKSMCFDCEMATGSGVRSRGNSIDPKEKPTISFLGSEQSITTAQLASIQDELRTMVADVARISAGKKTPIMLDQVTRARSETTPKNSRI